jgi:hypothetical protein
LPDAVDGDEYLSDFGDSMNSPKGLPDSDEVLLAQKAKAAAVWMDQYNRLAETSALAFNVSRVKPAGHREWLSHRESVAVHAASFSASPLVPAGGAAPASSSAASGISPSSLPARAASLRALLDRISTFERRLQQDGAHADSRREFVQMRDRLDELATTHRTLSEQNAADTKSLSDAENALADTLETLKVKKESMDDDGGLRTLRRTIVGMRVRVETGKAWEVDTKKFELTMCAPVPHYSTRSRTSTYCSECGLPC